MYFDFGAFIESQFRAFFKSRGTPYRLTFKRFFFLIGWLLIYIPAEVVNRLFFLLDEILFPKYRRQEIREPIFIIGNPRSGTTFLHRLLYQDRSTFTSFTVWELALAPSITQRKIIWGLVKIGRWIGRPFTGLAKSINRWLKKSRVDKTHAIRLAEAEEDEHIMIHAWASETLFNLYPFLDKIFPYFYYDQAIPQAKQAKLMRFYKSMLKRHLYAHGGDKILLSKNPSYSSKVAALTEHFPDARFIKLVRNPFEAVPSMLNVMAMGLDIFCDPKDPYAYKSELMDLMNHYYFYPVQFFEGRQEPFRIIRYSDLTQQPSQTVSDLYAWLGLAQSDSFKALVAETTRTQRKYKSAHRYPLQEMGLSRQILFKTFEEVFHYYDFPTNEFELPERELSRQKQGRTKAAQKERRRFPNGEQGKLPS